MLHLQDWIAMKRIEFMLAVSTVVLASALGAAAQSESLGDQARAARNEKRPAAKKVYTNDNLPTSASISVVGPLAQSSSDERPEAKLDEKEKEPAKESKTAEKKTPQDEQGWRDQIAEQKKKIASLEKDLDLAEREYKVMASEYYADAGFQLRNPEKWAKDDAKFRAEIADKQKKLEELKNQLPDMEEQARKAGMPSSVSDPQ